MKALVVHRYGNKVASRITEIPEPKPVNIEGLVRVHAVDEDPLVCATTASALCESTTI
jgi:NADPH:quinone reductase-like Zn-dependent oxidoreductase